MAKRKLSRVHRKAAEFALFRMFSVANSVLWFGLNQITAEHVDGLTDEERITLAKIQGYQFKLAEHIRKLAQQVKKDPNG